MSSTLPLHQRPSVFIGSSSEAFDRRIVDYLVTGLGAKFSLRPWYEIFTQGLFTLQALIRESFQVDAAILVFTKDDKRESRGRLGSVTRDNVNVEYGLFLGTLGLSRLWVLCERGVELPTDLLGLTVSFFDASDDQALKSSIRLCIDEVQAQWAKLPKRNPIEDGGTGLSKSLHEQKEQLQDILDRLDRYSWGHPPQSGNAVYFDSNGASRTAYAEALEKVEKRFWTTSYITSGFWARSDAEDIMNANIDLLRRLTKNGGEVRRIFLLDHAPEEKANKRKRDLINLRREGADVEIARLYGELERIQRRVDQLVDLGCEIKVIYDRIGVHFPHPVRFESFNTEIAIYDEFRVDFYGGGNIKTITDAQIFTDLTSNFNLIKGYALHYFEQLWSSQYAVAPSSLIDLFKRAHVYSASRIDYQSNWLARYEYNLNSADRKMKDSELECVKERLRSYGRLGNIRSMLDIGTCTARYPIEFYHDVEPTGRIIGIDNDADCIEFARAQKDRKTKGNKIDILEVDFTSSYFPNLGKFDLITCMLGTISHFGWDSPRKTLELTLQRMHDLLDDNGILIICGWSDHALESSKFLNIYNQQDKDRLIAWTPKSSRLKELFSLAGLSFVEDPLQPHDCLDVYILTKNAG